MRFTKDSILALPNEHLSPVDKRLLVQKHFPETLRAPWQDKLVEIQRWRYYLNLGLSAPDAKSYRFSHDRLMREARRRAPPTPRETVSDFTSWIYSLYSPPPDSETLANGRRVERAVARLAPVPSNKDWDLWFEDPLTQNREVKLISSLTVNGKPLRAVPDLVFREKATGRFLIVERKASNKEVPLDGWPNLRAQLWAYSKIDEWANAPEVLLVGEVWGFSADRVFPRAVVRWSRDDPVLDRNCAELFHAYRGIHV